MSAGSSHAGTGADRRLGYRVDEVSSLTGLPTSSIYSAIKRGQIRVARLGKAIVIPAAELERLLEPSA